MLVHAIRNFVSFVAVYTCSDAVLPDLDADDVIPEKLRWMEGADRVLVPELLHLIQDGRWKLVQHYSSENATIEWMYSQAYRRDVLKLTAYVDFPRRDVVDAIWLEEYLHSSWNHETFMDSKVLDYAGDNRIIMWTKTRPPLGQETLLSARDGVMYSRLIEDFGKFLELEIPDIKEQYSDLLGISGPAISQYGQIGSSAILATNTTIFGYDYPKKPGVVRGVVGTCGMIFVDVPGNGASKTTKMIWITNNESFPPSFVPSVIVRRITTKSMRRILADMKRFLRHKLQAT